MLRAIAQSFQRSLDVEMILQNVLRLSVEVMRLHTGWIWLAGVDGGFKAVAKYNAAEGIDAVGPGNEREGGCYCQRMLLAGQLRQAVNVVACERLQMGRGRPAEWGRATSKGTPIRNHASVPLLAGDKILGVMNLAHAGDKLLGDDELDFLSVVGQMLGLAIHRTQLYSQARELQIREQETLFQLSGRILEVMEPAAIARAAIPAIRLHQEASSISVYVASDGVERLDLLAADGWAEDHVGRKALPQSPPDSSGAAWSLHVRYPVLEDPNSEEAEFTPLQELRDHEISIRLNVPMILQGKAVGVIALDDVVPRPYGEDQLRFLSVVANIVATALEKGRLYGTIQTQLRRLQGLAEVSQLMQAEEMPDTILETILRVALRILEATRGGIFLHTRPGGELKEVTAIGLTGDDLRVFSLPAFGLVGGSRLHEIGPLVVQDAWVDPRLASWRADLKTMGCRSYAVISLVLHDQRVGSLIVCREATGAFDADALRVAQTLADQAAMTIERAKLLDQSYRQTRELAGLYEIAMATGTALDTRSFFRRLHDQVRSLINLDSFGAALFHSESDELEVVLALDQGAPVAGLEGKRYPLDHGGLTGWVMRMRRPLMVADVESDPLPVTPLHGTRPARSWLGVPLIARGRLIGAVSVQSFVPNAFADADLRFLEAVAGQVATALENARLLDETRRRAAQQEALGAIIAAAATAPDLVVLLGTALDHTLRALSMSIGGIWVADQFIGRGLPDGIFQEIESFFGRGGLRIVDPIRVEDWEKAASYQRWAALGPLMRKHTMRSLLVVPIVAQGRQIGGLAITATSPRRWSDEEVALVESVGRQLGEAAERLALLETSRQQAHQLQRLLDTVQEGIVALDGERRVVLANPAGQAYLSALGDAGPGEILSRLGGRPLEELLDSTQAGLPNEVQTDGAKPRVFEIYANPAPVGQGSAGWMLLLRDVTEARQVQARIQQQERLAAVGQLAAGIAHDFNNTMAAIILYSEMLLGKPDIDPMTKDRLTTVLRQAERAAALTRQILDFSRRAVMEPQPMEMKPLLKELAKLLVRTLPENIHVTLEVCSADCVVNADPGRLQQVFMNLAFNARDAMAAGGNLRFSLARLSSGAGEAEELPSHVPAGDWVRVAVSDTGVGIPADIVPHIFEPFFTTKPVGQGTGLGLAQAYGIIKQHNGLIDVKSTYGEGTTFTIFIPAMGIEQGVDSAPSMALSPHGRGETILVVEDNAATAQAVADILESLDYSVLSAKNGREALELYQSARERVHLVFTDLVMPEMGGMQLYRALRELNPNVKVVLTTGYPLGTGTKELLGQGNLSWIQKPYNSDVLAQCLRKALDS